MSWEEGGREEGGGRRPWSIICWYWKRGEGREEEVEEEVEEKEGGGRGGGARGL
jgi:hypothetical protein